MSFQPGRSWPTPRGSGSGPRRELRAQQLARSVGASSRDAPAARRAGPRRGQSERLHQRRA
eukprot:5596031-Alexandrium_andersonii.AAC.1